MSTAIEKLEKKIETLERKLLRVPSSLGSVEKSIALAENQVAYWVARQTLHSMKAADPDESDHKGHFVEARKCTEMAAEWERRKTAAHDKIILRKLEDIERRLDIKKKQKDRTSRIET